MKSNLPCNLCGNEDIELVSERDRDGNALRNVICKNCGLVWVDPRPSADEISEFYSSSYRVEYKGAYQPKAKHAYRETRRAIARLDRLMRVYKPGMKILDVGSGAGFFPYVLSKKCIDVTGIEPNKGYAEYARNELGLEGIIVGNLFDYDGEKVFDLITIHHVYEHLAEPCASLQRLFLLLKDDGLVIMEIPNIEATYHAPDNIFHLGHLYWFNPENIRAMAHRNNFTVEDIKIELGTQHINLILRKGGEQEKQDWQDGLRNNYNRVMKIRRGHTRLRHYLSRVPYKRMINKIQGHFNEKKYVEGLSGGREIVDRVCSDQLH